MPVEVILTDRIRGAIEDAFGLEILPKELENELANWRRSGIKIGDSNVEDISNKNDLKIPFKTVKIVFETLKRGMGDIILY